MVFLAWYPGAEAERLWQIYCLVKVSPSGKLPVTFYKDLEGMPEFTDYSMKNRTYRYMEGEALYPFGYGLTYGKVQVKEARVLNEVTRESDIEVQVTAENRGNLRTEEVVQIYIKDLESPLAVRNYSLCAFGRVDLEAGESKTLTLRIPNRAMEVVDEQGNRHIDSKHFKLFAGISQPDKRSEELTGEKSVPVNVILE